MMCHITFVLSVLNLALILWTARRTARLHRRASVLRVLEERRD